jgi:hypothetical protein
MGEWGKRTTGCAESGQFIGSLSLRSPVSPRSHSPILPFPHSPTLPSPSPALACLMPAVSRNIVMIRYLRDRAE